VIDFGTYFISEWPFLAPEQPSLLLRPRLSPSTIQVGGVLLAREQRRLAAILTADVVGYSHAAYEQIYYSSLMPRTNLCARLLETLD
jgi:hypothetical protein